MFFNIPQGPAAAYQRGCVMFFTMLLFELLPFCYVSFYSWDRKFFLADRESGIYATSAYYVAHMCASESRLTDNPVSGALTLMLTCGPYGAAFLQCICFGASIVSHTCMPISSAFPSVPCRCPQCWPTATLKQGLMQNIRPESAVSISRDLMSLSPCTVKYGCANALSPSEAAVRILASTDDCDSVHQPHCLHDSQSA